MTWRYLATRIHGDGTETFLGTSVPLTDVEIHQVVNGHGGLKATIEPEHGALKQDGEFVFEAGTTGIYAEVDGFIRGGGILTGFDTDGPKIGLDCVGHTGYLTGMPYTGHKVIERDDPLKVSRHLWDHTQTRKNFNLGIEFTGATTSRTMFIGDDTIDPSSTPVKVTPYVLAYWQTHDLAKEFDNLASLAPFEYTLTHTWNTDKTRILHTLTYGYPRLGARRTDLRFTVGENIAVTPSFKTDDDAYASNVIVLGAGEGQKMMRAEDADPAPGRLGRYEVITDKSITTPTAARQRAAAERRARTGQDDISDIVVTQHPHARLGSYQVGDDILINTADGWQGRRSVWVKILGIQIRPATNTTTLQVRRAEKVTQ